MTPLLRLWPAVLLWFAGCSTQPPAPLGIDHPAHPDAPTSPTGTESTAGVLSNYRDFSPPARGTKSAPATNAETPVDGGGHEHHQ